MNNQIFQESEKKIITMTNSDNDEHKRNSDYEQENSDNEQEESNNKQEESNNEQEESDNEQEESDNEQEEYSYDEQQEESDNEQEEYSYDEQEESDDKHQEESDDEQQEYEDELNYKKQMLKSFSKYLEVVIKSIDDKKHNKKIINELYYIVDIYYKNNKDSEIVKYFNTNQVKLKKKENNIFESFINKTIDINKRLIKESDISNSILYLNNFITNSIFF